MIELKGHQNKSVVVEGDTVRIIKGSRLFASARDKALPIRNIASVEVKKPGALWHGFIQFAIAGGKAKDSSFTWTGGSYDAASDENSVIFTDESSYQTALQIKQYIESYSDAQKPTSQISAADEIAKMKALMDSGILTDEEFAAKKRQLLGL